MTAFVVGAAFLMAAVALLAQALFADPVQRVAKRRLAGTAARTEPLWRTLYRSLVTGVDRVLKSRGWVPFRASELELADVRRPLGVVVTWVAGAAIVMFLAGTLLGRSPVEGVLLALLAPLLAKVTLRVRTNRRRRAFAQQLDPTLRVVASALRAGQSLPMALSSVAADAVSPMAEEMTRIINENRLGRDLVEAMRESADRMESEDLEWFAGAVQVQRDAGGNLNDIIDTVAETIRERAEIREKIRANASEGKASAWVLMALPIALGVAYSVLNPGYMDPLFITAVGRFLLVVSSALYVAAFFWMRAIVNFKV